jgi:hypothetical protein
VSTADLNRRFDELIKVGKTLLPFQSGSLEYLAKKERWEAQCQVTLERAFGKDGIFLRKFQAVLNYGNMEAHITHGVALLEAAKEELDLNGKSTKLDEIETEIKEGEAEAKRRETVAESKFWGSVIELIQLQRDELKRRSQVDQEIAEIRKEITDLRLLLTKLIPEENKQTSKP